MPRLRYDALEYIAKHGNDRARLRVWAALGRAGSREAQRAMQRLLDQQDPDGGWSWRMETHRPSSVLDTARAVEALTDAGLPVDHESILQAAASLLPLQRKDGGWSENKALRDHIPWDWDWYSVDYSIPSITARALYTLHLAGHEWNKAIKRGLRFLRRAQNEEGGWPGHVGPTYPYGTDWASMFPVVRALRTWDDDAPCQEIVDRALAAIHDRRECWATPIDNPLDTFLLLGHDLEHPDVQEALEHLVEAQRPDGGWNWFGDLPSSPGQTANWIVALARAGFDLTPGKE